MKYIKVDCDDHKCNCFSHCVWVCVCRFEQLNGAATTSVTDVENHLVSGEILFAFFLFHTRIEIVCDYYFYYVCVCVSSDLYMINYRFHCYSFNCMIMLASFSIRWSRFFLSISCSISKFNNNKNKSTISLAVFCLWTFIFAQVFIVVCFDGIHVLHVTYDKLMCFLQFRDQFQLFFGRFFDNGFTLQYISLDFSQYDLVVYFAFCITFSTHSICQFHLIVCCFFYGFLWNFATLKCTSIYLIDEYANFIKYAKVCVACYRIQCFGIMDSSKIAHVNREQHVNKHNTLN